MTQIICLANSWKRGERCIAGINPKNAQWIRPVSNLPDGKIPREMRLINAMEPALLDILEIPLASTGPDYGFESENRSVLPGKWQKIGKITSSDIVKYLSNEEYILHNKFRYVTVSYMQSLPPSQRQSLQLVKALIFTVKAIGKRVE
ncbi:MAG: dual OB domain-containing protein, partial [Microcoleaceae cyanobacterium]